MKSIAIGLVLSGLVAGSASAELVQVTVTGQVGFNAIGDPPLSGVGGGESAEVSFTVDSNDFVEGVPGDTRGYLIDPSSFAISFSGGVSVGLLAAPDSYFTLVEGFPISDGFFVSTSPFSPGGAPLDQTPYNFNLDLGYSGDTLSSLDILDAVGTYDFGGLTRFGFNIWRISPDNVVLDMDFEQMTISAIPAPAALSLLVLAGMSRRRRRA